MTARTRASAAAQDSRWRAARVGTVAAPTRRWAGRLRGDAGQSVVELVALLPLYAAVAIGILQALAAGAAGELAGHAAQSAAVALAQGRDGAAAARGALPGWARDRIEVRVARTRVTVVVTPPSLLPGLGKRLRTTASADAGPAT
ncbi:pilus assembly protein [Conexibacter arvalis]|uniref:TadE-like protein n=1 Tax=Conexibacter arvalis TaxID=912552 RepID=A0A840II88_9ACTN|nr:pilus assembly protein [Conexibacter arvalis]MBB4664489.1 hypothetical protein [Conexibacter arvalis]